MFAGTVVPQTYELNATITPLALPEGAGGTAPLTYTLEPEIPGLTFDATHRMLSGTPTSAGTYNMIYTVTDAIGETLTLRFVIVVMSEPASTNVGMAFREVEWAGSYRDYASTQCTSISWTADTGRVGNSQQLQAFHDTLKDKCEANLGFDEGGRCHIMWSHIPFEGTLDFDARHAHGDRCFAYANFNFVP